MIDPFHDDLILLRDFAKRLPGDPSYQTVWSWAKHGRRALGDEGELVFLETVKMPAGRSTTIEAYRTFIEKLTTGMP